MKKLDNNFMYNTSDAEYIIENYYKGIKTLDTMQEHIKNSFNKITNLNYMAIPKIIFQIELKKVDSSGKCILMVIEKEQHIFFKLNFRISFNKENDQFEEIDIDSIEEINDLNSYLLSKHSLDK